MGIRKDNQGGHKWRAQRPSASTVYNVEIMGVSLPLQDIEAGLMKQDLQRQKMLERKNVPAAVAKVGRGC